MARFGNFGALMMPQFKAAPSVALDPTKVGSSLTLSNGNYRATASATTPVDVNAGSLVGRSSGKYYFEAVWTIGASLSGIGLGLSSFGWTGAAILGSGTSYIFTTSGGTRFNGANTAHAGNAWSGGEYVAIAVDLTAGQIWFRDGAGWTSGDPAAGTSPQYSGMAAGPWYAGITCVTANDVVNVNFGQSAFNYTIPSGFTGWDL